VGAAHQRKVGADVEELPDSGLEDEVTQHTLLEPADGGRDGGYHRRRCGQRPGGLAVGLEVVLAAVHVVCDAFCVGHQGADERGFRPARRVFPPVLYHGYKYATKQGFRHR
jgi:hypothetical protein